MMLSAILGVILIAGLLEAGELRLADASSVLGNGEWINVSDLKAGDIIQTADGRTLRIKSITDVESAAPVSCYGFATNATNQGYVLDSGIVASGKGLPAATAENNRCGWGCRILKYFGILNR